MGQKHQTPTPRSILGPISAIVLCALLWPAVITFDVGDWPSPNQFPHNLPVANACGVVGAYASYFLHYYLGAGLYPLLIFATFGTLMRLSRGVIEHFTERVFGLALVILASAVSAHLVVAPESAGLPVGHGGLLGFATAELLRENLSRVGTIIIVVSSLFVGLLFTTQGWVLRVPGAFLRASRKSSAALASIRRSVADLASGQAARYTDGITMDERDAILAAPTRSRRRKRKALREEETEEEFEEDESVDEASLNETDLDEEAEDDTCDTDQDVDFEEEEVEEAVQPVAKVKPPRKRDPAPIIRFLRPQRVAKLEPYPRKIENWTLPSLELLHEVENNFSAQQEVIVREQAKVLERTLEEFRLDAHVVEIDTGPVITMFELKLGAGIKVAQIATLANDIARALKAHAIRVVAPISGKNTVGIEVPNIEKEKVRLKELMTVSGRKASQMGLPLFLGKDAGGAVLVADLTKMPHLLIAGTTGSGKSVCMNAIVLSLLMTQRPDQVKMILVDPKMVEMIQFKDVPHLMCPIVTDMSKAEKILEWLVTRMEERYELLAEARVKNINGYNNLTPDQLYTRLNAEKDEERARVALRLPYIVVIIDELADLMMISGKEVEHHLCRLAQKSRAVGIHIIVATQRPEVKVVTGLIKSNLPSRISFRVASRMDSRIVLDQNGGEVLMGQGDMLFLPPGSHKLLRAQGTYLEDEEIQAVLDDLSGRAKPEFHPDLMRIKTPGQDTDLAMRDPLFDKAVRIILETKRGSVSLLQRRLTIGYSRASRLIDMMAQAGIVGEYKGSQAREVALTLAEWEALQAQVARERTEGYLADMDDQECEDEVEAVELVDADDAEGEVECEDQADEEEVEDDDGKVEGVDAEYEDVEEDVWEEDTTTLKKRDSSHV